MIHVTLPQLCAYLDGQLAEASAELVRRHLSECLECTERFASLEAQDEILVRVLGDDPPEEFFQSLSASIPLGRTTNPERPAPAARPRPTKAPSGRRAEDRKRNPIDPRVVWLAAGICCVVAGSAAWVAYGPRVSAPGAPSSPAAPTVVEEPTTAPEPTAGAEPEHASAPEGISDAPLLRPEEQAVEPSPTQPPQPSPTAAQPSPISASVAPSVIDVIATAPVAGGVRGERPPASPDYDDQGPAGDLSPRAPSPSVRPASGRSTAAPKAKPTAPTAPVASAAPQPERLVERAPQNLVPVRTVITETVIDPTPSVDSLAAAVPKAARANMAPDPMTVALRDAKSASLEAARTKLPASFDKSAEAWERALPLLEKAPEELAAGRRELAQSRFQAWAAEPTPARREAAIASARQYLLYAPPGPERDQAWTWLGRLKH